MTTKDLRELARLARAALNRNAVRGMMAQERLKQLAEGFDAMAEEAEREAAQPKP
jgi:hypothetical protein